MFRSFAPFAVLVASALSGCIAQGDYFLLVRSWDPSVCEYRHCKDSVSSRFTIHGLWPEYNDGSWPQFCAEQPFSEENVEDLLPVLRREWPSLFTKNASFWRHEWLKHGTCAEKLCSLLTNEHAFFFAVLALNKMYDLNAAAKATSIPLNTPVSQEWLEEQLSDAFGHKLAVHCSYRHGGDPASVAEVWMCLDAQMQPFDCPDYIYRSCHSKVVLPTIGSLVDDIPRDALNPGDFVGPQPPGAPSDTSAMPAANSIHELVLGTSLSDPE
eukprot:jgi/Ulvmu1/3932/UM018_0155.1